MKRVAAFIIGVLAAGLLSSPAHAAPGDAQDADDTSYKNDMRAVYHDDSGSTITYYLQFYDDIDETDWRCYLGLDFNEDSGAPRPPSGPQPEEDAHIDITPKYDSATVADTDYANSVEGSLTRAAAPTASGSTAQNTLKVTVTKDAYVQVGMSSGDTGYRYAVGCGAESPPGSWGEYPDYGDRIPDDYEAYPIVHTFGGSTPQTPTPQTPTAPTPQPRTPAPPAPEEPATASPPPTALALSSTPTPTDEEAEASASPRASLPPLTVDETSGGSSAVGLLAGAAVVAAAAAAGGLALARRRTG